MSYSSTNREAICKKSPTTFFFLVNEMFARAEQENEADGNPTGLDVGSFAHPSGAVGGYMSINSDSSKPQQVLPPQVWGYNSEGTEAYELKAQRSSEH